jgi:hypothetical protein
MTTGLSGRGVELLHSNKNSINGNHNGLSFFFQCNKLSGMKKIKIINAASAKKTK